MAKKTQKSDAEWREQLGPDRYAVLREAGTERAFSGEYHDCKESGIYRCAGCGSALFRSTTKFDSGTGWPSFFEALAEDVVEERTDTSHGMVRSEVLCRSCGGHLGHVFPDGPPPSGRRYCMNSLALRLDREADPEGPTEDEG